ncbi:MAG: putative Ig domain-containing protein, partial [Acidimicrobiales bacterium]
PTTCTSGSWTQFDTESLSGSANPDTVTSASFTPTSTGYWCFAGVYSGDSNYSGSSDATTDECFDVTAASTSTTTTPTSSTGALGGPNSDVGVVTGNAAGGSPTGKVSFYECGPTPTPAPCTSQANPVGSAVGLTAGAGDTSSATSVNFTATSTGWWCFAGYYSGDSNYSASSDTSTDECFDVTSGSTSTMSTPTNSTITLGQSDTDHATVTGNAAGGSPTGTVSFYECGPTSIATPCTSTANQVGTAVNLTAGAHDASTAGSVSFTPTSAGYWCYGAYYSGDANYSPSSDTTVDECVLVTNPLTITTASPLRDGTVHVKYSVKLKASGGTAPYKWKVVSGSLPHGISLSSAGKLSGSATVTGDFNFTVRVRDSSHPNETASKTFTLKIND